MLIFGAVAHFTLYGPVHFSEMKTGTRFTAKNTCLRLYLAWLDHNHNAKIVGPAPAHEWALCYLSDAKFSNKACVNHEPQCVKASPAHRGSSLVKIRTLAEKNTRLVIGCWELELTVAPEAVF